MLGSNPYYSGGTFRALVAQVGFELKTSLEFYSPVISSLSSLTQSSAESMDNVGVEEPEAEYDDNEGDNEELEDNRRESGQLVFSSGQVRRGSFY